MSQTFEKIRSYFKGNLGVMILSSGLWSLSGGLTWPFFSLYVLELGGDYMAIGTISAIGAIIKIIPTFLGGYLADSHGRKKLVYILTYLLAINALINGFAPNYRFLLLAAITEAIFMGLREPAFSSIVADSTTSDSRALGYALWSVVPQLFGILSPTIIGLFMDQYGIREAMRWGYSAVFVLGVLSAYLRQRYLKETLVSIKRKERLRSRSVSEFINDFKTTIRVLPRNLWVFLGIDLIFTLGWGVSEPYFVTYARDGAGLTSAQWGLVMSAMILVNMVFKVIGAEASDRFGRTKFIFATMFGWSITFLVYIYTGNFIQVMIVRLAIALSSCIGEGAWEALFIDYSPKEHRGRFNAITSTLWSLSWGAGNYLGGFLYQNYSIRLPFIVTSGMMIIATFLALIFVKEPEKREA